MGRLKRVLDQSEPDTEESREIGLLAEVSRRGYMTGDGSPRLASRKSTVRLAHSKSTARLDHSNPPVRLAHSKSTVRLDHSNPLRLNSTTAMRFRARGDQFKVTPHANAPARLLLTLLLFPKGGGCWLVCKNGIVLDDLHPSTPLGGHPISSTNESSIKQTLHEEAGDAAL